jgi:hypothetical protein
MYGFEAPVARAMRVHSVDENACDYLRNPNLADRRFARKLLKPKGEKNDATSAKGVLFGRFSYG